MAEAVFDETVLNEFKRVYSLAGPQRIQKQTPYLAELAKHYEEKGKVNPRRNWTDILKAHALYNSCAVRDTSTEWKEDAFRVQQLYWGNGVNTTYQTQTELTESLMSELKYIRGLCKRCLTSPSAEIEKWESDIEKLDQMGDSGIYRETEKFVKKMQIVSNICNGKMLKFAQLCVEKAVALCGDSPCKFAVVSLGSMARGEVTPYSDWEFLFLVYKKTAETVSYFELLAMTCYFIIGNLGETKLRYMNITELTGWFEDCAKSGFKIDGLQACAGNIPTGNGINKQDKNKFIQTPAKLKRMYARLSAKPTTEAISGDLTAMLTSTVLVYGDDDLLDEFDSFKKEHKRNEKRFIATIEMLEQDLVKYGGVMEDRRLIDIKKEIYRYPTLFLFNLKILCQARSSNSWELIKELQTVGILRAELKSSLKFMLAAALYIRLSMYLHYDSQYDQLLLSDKNQEPGKCDQWFLPFSLDLHLAMHIRAVQRKEVSIHQVPWQIVITALNNPLWHPIYLDPVRTGIELYERMGQMDDYEKYITLAMKMCKSHDDIPIWLKFGNIAMLNSQQKYQQAIQSAKQCLESVEAKVVLQVKITIELLLSRIFLGLQNKKACESYSRLYSTEAIMDSNMNLDQKSVILFEWAKINAQIDREDQAEIMYREAVKLSESINHFSLQLDCTFNLMAFYHNRHMQSEATETAPKVLNLINRANFYADKDMATKGMWAHIVLLEGYKDKKLEVDLREALKNGYLSLTYQRRVSSDLKLINKTLRRLAMIHMKLEEYERARLLLENAYRAIKAKSQLLPESSDWTELELCMTDMATCLLMLGQAEEAAHIHMETLAAKFMAEIQSIPASNLARSVILSLEINTTNTNSNEIAAS